MLVPVKWLKEYINIDADTKEIAGKVTDSGSHVESISSYEKMNGLVVAEILECKPYENSEKLNLVEINYGEGVLTLISGASNMKKGDKVVYAKVGANLPGGINIQPKVIQGYESHGMLCGYSELGVSESHVSKNSEGGLIILDESAPIGVDAVEYLGLDGEVIEFEITPNRPDCLSIIGMAREVAAVYDAKISEPKVEIKYSDSKYADYFNGVKLESENSPRFLTAVVKNVVIKDSPIYIQNYLRDAGMRPINNIVDFTNFIMLEYGQPMHAYDLDKIKGKALIVREGKKGETLTTLDDVERKVEDDDLLICDGENSPIGFAGIMGGQAPEVTENTKTILIEAANFISESIRKTSKRLGLRSEASSRFEKGVSPKLAEIGLNRFLGLVSEYGAGEVVQDINEQGTFVDTSRTLKLRQSRVNSLLGIDLTLEESKKYLDSLELSTEISGEELNVSIPYFRDDLTIEVDLIEEIGRLYGFHNIAPKPLIGELTKGVKSDLRNLMDKMRNNLYSLGYSEILTYSFISRKQFDKLNLEENSKLRDTINIINPLGEDFSVMRTTLIGNMLDAIRKNLNNKQFDLKLSEVGNTFSNIDGQMIETKLMTFGLVGGYDFFDAKNTAIALLEKVGISNIRFEREENNPIFHSGRCANIMINGELVGIVGEISPFVTDSFDIEKRVYISEINLDKVQQFKNDLVQYKSISKYPLVERDIAFIIDENIESQSIIDVIKENGGEYVKFAELFDRYKGSQIAEGKVSLAFKIGFQSDDRTLKDEEVKESMSNISKALSETFDIDLRS